MRKFRQRPSKHNAFIKVGVTKFSVDKCLYSFLLGFRRCRSVTFCNFSFLKAAATDMRHLARSKFSWSLIYKKNFGWISQVVFQLDYLSREVGYLF